VEEGGGAGVGDGEESMSLIRVHAPIVENEGDRKDQRHF
jgi:hypothetical protein